MNEESSSPEQPAMTDNDRALLYLTALRYVLAGDLGSVEPLETIADRIRSIEWNEPAFLQFTADMRAGMPSLSTDQEKILERPLLAILHALHEGAISSQEAMERSVHIHKKKDQHIAYFDKVNAGLLEYLADMLEIHNRMIDRLQVLSASTDEFSIPELSRYLPPRPPV